MAGGRAVVVCTLLWTSPDPLISRSITAVNRRGQSAQLETQRTRTSLLHWNGAGLELGHGKFSQKFFGQHHDGP